MVCVCVCVCLCNLLSLTHLGLKPREFIMCLFLLCCVICLPFACRSVLLHVSLNVLFVIVLLFHVVSSVLLLNCLVHVAVGCLLPSLNS